MYYPPVGFHFKVEVLGLRPIDDDVRFSEVSGLAMEMATEEVAEGGENRYVQKYPLRARYPELVLKRGLLKSSEILNWIEDCVRDYKVVPHDVDVKLLDEKHDPLLTWHLVNAYPTKWTPSDLSATNNAVVIESLQLFYQYFTLQKD